ARAILTRECVAPSSLARREWNITNTVLPSHARNTESVIAIRLSRRRSRFSPFFFSFSAFFPAFFSRCAASSSGVLGGLGGLVLGSTSDIAHLRRLLHHRPAASAARRRSGTAALSQADAPAPRSGRSAHPATS